MVTASTGKTIDVEIAVGHRVSRLSTQSKHNRLSILNLAITGHEMNLVTLRVFRFVSLS